ncbi:MAG TPA: hypothetical protein VII31_13925 [Caldimonas sp.]|jgi:hypothetical protein
MKDPTIRPDRGAARRLLVTLTITFAAATVMAGVALNHRPSQVAAAPAARALTTAAPALADFPKATLSDPSVPGASEALGHGAEEAREPTATF